MEKNRMRSRKRYCCYYCNTFFYQVDSWQRHNRKHTGVEIECEDCGEMCSDHLELKSHQQLCDGYRVYSDDLCTRHPIDEHPSINKQICVSERDAENSSTHETPDSTSKQESIPENESIERAIEVHVQEEDSLHNSLLSKVKDANTQKEIPEGEVTNSDPNKDIPENTELSDVSQNTELDDLIGEDKVTSGNENAEDTDPATEALIGIDQNEVTQMKNEAIEQKPLDSSIGVDTQIIMKVDSFSMDVKRNTYLDNLENKESRRIDMSSFFNRPSPVGAVMDSVQTISLENAEMNKKYQPYFCKNCGARFTRKDSVTRHLKKGTCSGKSAIVCNICGKVFAEMFELQDHFKMEHKNVVFTPTVVHRSILPRGETPEQGPYAHYPTHYVVHDQHLVPVTRPYLHPEQTYRPMPPGLQTMFYGNPTTYTPRPGYPSPAGHFHDPLFQPQPIELKYSPNSQVGKDITFVNNPGKLVLQRTEELSRKRDYPREHHGREHNQYEDPNCIRKNRKIELEQIKREPHTHSSAQGKTIVHQNINLSEYTNNAMSAKQYYDNRFSKTEPSAGKEEPPRTHQCKVCGLEFPRFEYLLTHLRKHKEKDVDRADTFEDKEKMPKEHSFRQIASQPSEGTGISYPNNTSETFMSTSLSDSSSTSSDDGNDNVQKLHFVMAHSSEKPPIVYTTNDPVPVVAPQSLGIHHPLNERYCEQPPIYTSQHTPLGQSSLGEGGLEALTPGVDGKFRPFICENCGQRFTRKDSLVRHAKKQTCFEEITDLKCKHCDKTFRYHKCLLQHQELVHGIPHDDQKQQFPPSEDEGSESDKSYKNDIDEEIVVPAGTECKYLPDTEMENSKLRVKSEYFGHQISPYSQHSQDYQSHPPREHPREHHLPLGEHIISPREKLSSIIDAPLSHEQRDEQSEPREHPLSQRPSESQYHVGPTPFVPPIKEEKFKPLDSTPGSNAQESQYIGYCMLPRPFQCEYCGDRFAHRHSLKRHVRRHLGIGIPCHDCGKLYRDQSEWRRHQRSIHNRHYEKYEVPSRMSFRDGVEQGLIGIVPSSEYGNSLDNEDGSGSEKSDDELSMAKQQCSYQSSPVKIIEIVANDDSSPTVVNPSINHDDDFVSNIPAHRADDFVSNKPAHFADDFASNKPAYFADDFVSSKPAHLADEFPTNEEKSPSAGNKEEKLKVFDFKSHSAGDKDTRKSVLDLYLCSPNSDEDFEKNQIKSNI